MTVEGQTLLAKVKNFFEVLLALKITEAERLRFASDPYNPFLSDTSGRKPLQVAAVLSLPIADINGYGAGGPLLTQPV